MSLKEQLDTEIKEYNEFAHKVNEAKQRAEQLEQERLIRLGGVQKLAEIVQKEEAKAMSIKAHENGSKNEVAPEVVESAVKSAEN